MIPIQAEKIFNDWFAKRGWKAFPFQYELLEKYLNGYSGLLNAPTGSGKTYAIWLPIMVEWLLSGKKINKDTGLQVLYLTPIRALVNDIKLAMQSAANELSVEWNIASRTGDTDTSERQRQKKNIPQCLITTPESVHLMLAQKDYAHFFKNLKVVVVDEWHELIGSKRGVQVELALSRLKTICPGLKIWGISATIGNLEQAKEVLLGLPLPQKNTIVKSSVEKKIEIISIAPAEIEKYPWGGHLGVKLLPQVIPVLEKSKTTLVFTNTRAQSEIWYQALLEAKPEWAGLVALHHGSLSREIREWVEENLHAGNLKCVVCTSSLDLGVDFRPVETVVQIGGPKGVARFLQRAGRSGHSPGALSVIYFVPAHSLELIEAAALRTAIAKGQMEERTPVVRAFDVLSQYLVTLAVSDGFNASQIFKEIKTTHAYESIEPDEWHKVLTFITTGSASLSAYDEFKKVEIENGNHYKVNSKRIALMHRLSIGTIVSDASVTIKYLTGGFIGTVEEYFVSKLNVGDVFTFGGKNLEVISIRNMELRVRKSNKKTSNIPSWQGGRMQFSSRVSAIIRQKITEELTGNIHDEELHTIKPIFDRQKEISIVPAEEEFLLEYLEDKEGFHLFGYTFEGRFVNEGIAALISQRISSHIKPMTFSISMTDYGFELLSDEPIPVEEALEIDIFSTDNLVTDILAGLNSTEMARRKFRDIAHIAGLIFTGYPGKQIKNRHLQASARNFFDVFRDYEPNNLLFKQAYEEVLFDQLDEVRIRQALNRINSQKIRLINLATPSPFCFPIMVERIREKSSGESLEERVAKMLKRYKL